MILALSTKYGPATCACVPLHHYWLSFLLAPGYDAMRGLVRKETQGWPQCPTCHGAGVDPRIPA